MTEQKPLNGYVVISEIVTLPKTKSGIINPHTMKDAAPITEYDEHPWRGLVVFAPKYYYVGGSRYECEIQKGDVVTLPGEVIERGTAYLIIGGRKYPAIRHGDILSHYTPTEKELKSLVFAKDANKVSAITAQA